MNLVGATKRVIPINFNVSSNSTGTYTSLIKVTSNNAEPYNVQYVTLNLIISNNLLLNVSKNPSLVHSGEIESFYLNVSYLNLSGVTGLVAENITNPRLRYDNNNYINIEDYTLEELGNGNYILNISIPSGLVGGVFGLSFAVTKNLDSVLHSGYVSYGMSVNEQHLEAEYVNAYGPIDIDLKDTGSVVYKVNISNVGLSNSSAPITAQIIKSCSDTYMTISSPIQTISTTIEASSSRLVSWTLVPKVVKNDCEIKVNVSGGRWWSNSSDLVLVHTINISNSSVPVVPVVEEEAEAAGDPESQDGECSLSSQCADDESCSSDNVCVKLSCDEGMIAKGHRCVNEVITADKVLNYSMTFVGNYSDVETMRGEFVVLLYEIKNDGNVDIDNLKFNMVVDDELNDSVKNVLDFVDVLLVGDSVEVKYIVNLSLNVSSGYHSVVLVASSDHITIRKYLKLKVKFTDDEIEAIENNLNDLGETIDDLDKFIDQLMSKSDDNDSYVLGMNNTLNKIKILYESAKVDIENGDYFAANEKNKDIDDLLKKMKEESPDIVDILEKNGKFGSMLSIFIIMILLLAGVSYLVVKYDVPKKVQNKMDINDFRGLFGRFMML